MTGFLVPVLFADATAPPQTVTVGTATETDSAAVVLVAGVVAIGTATETNTAPSIAAVYDQTISVGTAAEADSARPLLGSIAGSGGAQGGLAFLFSRAAAPAQTIALGTATETDTARPITSAAAQTISVGTAVETDSAAAFGIPTNQSVTVGTAIEYDTAPVVLAASVTIIVHPKEMVPGTSISAYRRWEWKGPVAAKLNAGPGAAVATTTVASDLTASFNLPAGEYVAYAEDYPRNRLFFMVTE